MLRRRKDRPAARREDPDAEARAEVYAGLREQALGAVATGLAAPGPDHPDVWGAVVDVPVEEGWLSFVALGDGTTSMYTSRGGGRIGIGEHAEVAEANEHLLTVIQRLVLPHLDPEDGAHPPAGYVRVHVLRHDGLVGIDMEEAVFWGEEDGGGLFVSALQYLLESIRVTDDEPQR